MYSFKLQAHRGDTIVLQVPVTRNAAALDVTGATFVLTAKQWKTDVTPLIQKTGAAIVVPTPANGIVYITILPADTLAFEDTILLNTDVEMTESSGRVTTVAHGTLEILMDIT